MSTPMPNVTVPFAATQPALKLASANMGLLLRFTTSPEVMSEARAATGQLLQQGSALTLKMMHSGAFLQLMQGLMHNYTEFLGESGRAAAAWMQDGQAAMARAAQPAAAAAFEAATPRAGRAGQAR